MRWMTKFDETLIESRKAGLKFFLIEPPTGEFEKKISSGIIKNMMGLKIVGEKSKKQWKIVLTTPKKEKNLRVSVIKMV